MKGYVYLIQSISSNHNYLGSTPDCEIRLDEHNRGSTPATRYKGPWKLLKVWEFETLKEARQMEYKIKRTKTKLTIEHITELVEWFKNKG